MNQKTTKIMKKSILSLAFIFSLNLAQAQDFKLDTSDAFEGPLAKLIKDAPRPKVYDGTGEFDHSYSVGKLENIFNDNGASFESIFSQMSSEFPGVILQSNQGYIGNISLEEYFIKEIKGHSYDSISYSIDKSILSEDIEYEGISFYNANDPERVGFIQITRKNGEIINVMDHRNKR